MAGVEPIFEDLKQHMTTLESQAGAAAVGASPSSESPPFLQPVGAHDSALLLIFQNDVPVQLREMLQLFRQAEALSDGRARLQEVCRGLKGLGEAFDLYPWCDLVETASRAIAVPENSYRTLAPIVLKDLKQGQEAILAGRIADVAPSNQLQALAPLEALPDLAVDTDLADFFAISDSPEPTEPFDLPGLNFATQTTLDPLELNDLNFDAGLFETEGEDDREDTHQFGITERSGSEVGMAELNSLADLFEGEMPDLGATWQEEEVISHPATSLDFNGTSDIEDANDFSDLLFDEPAEAPVASSSASFGQPLQGSDPLGNFLGTEAIDAEPDDFGLPDFDAELSDLTELSSSNPSETDPFAGFELEDLQALDLRNESGSNFAAIDCADESEAAAPLDNLGELFAGLDENDLNFAQFSTTPAESNLAPTNSEFGGFDLDGMLEETALSESPANDWDSLGFEESAPLPSPGESSEAQSELGTSSDFSFDLMDLEGETAGNLTDLTELSLSDELEALPELGSLDDPWGELSNTNSLPELNDAGLFSDTENPFSFDAASLFSDTENPLSFGDQALSEDALSLGQADDEFSTLEAVSATNENPFSFDSLLTQGEFSPEPEASELNPIASSSLDLDAFDFDSNSLIDDLSDLSEPKSSLRADRSVGSGLDSLDDEFLSLGDVEGNLDALLGESTETSPLESEIALNSPSEADEESMAALFDAEDSLDFELNTTLEVSEDLGDLLGDSSELFNTAADGLDDGSDLFGSPLSETPPSEATIAPLPDSPDLGDFDFNFDNLDNDAESSLDDLLCPGVTEENLSDLNSLSSEGDDLDELFSLGEVAATESSEDALLNDDFLDLGSITSHFEEAALDQFSLEIASEDLSFDLDSPSEASSEEVDTLLNDFDLDWEAEKSEPSIVPASELDFDLELGDLNTPSQLSDDDLDFAALELEPSIVPASELDFD
ncbi:MAG: hypothetical protein HC780_22920, partial [Leptolyngbyaceae cyanobacterium CSU_1_3]|nr:hypothetical protein [Leptolyngbyaceae cyanobacterium CSU_1_3]